MLVSLLMQVKTFLLFQRNKYTMSYQSSLKVLILLVFLSSSVYSQKINFSVTDDLGRKISFLKTPRRVISLSPALTEYVFALKCEDKLVGNTTYCDYPAESKKITKVGDLLTFDFEKIISLNPDLILVNVEGNTKETFERLNELKLKTFVVNPRNFADIKKDMIKISEIFSVEKLAQKIIRDWEKDAELVIEKNKNRKNLSTMIIVELSPLMLAGKNTFLNEYLDLCNLNNITSSSTQNYPIYSREEIIVHDPDLIIFPSSGSENLDFILSYYPEWSELQTFKKKNVIFVNRDLYFRPGPRFVEALKDLSQKIN